ncbi:MAG: hydrogenase expression/formation protein HypE [Candidatus Heimdallarchaeota archaeon]|nr:hydrogenase expression/formation protein HypE [Candidatus Heimdallarchaeota archaeon]MBY8993608.1 hydrogenase expression/formation protein HypE [Candidatus Heimdallarchaeota archaeon]
MLPEFVEIAHGAGGKKMDEMLEIIMKNIKIRKVGDGIGLDEKDDGATISIGKKRIVTSIDGHTVHPIFFPGGNLGELAITGTINDVCVMGGKPIAILSSIIVEEGFPMKDLQKIVDSIAETADKNGVAIIAGDTKVMPRGTLDQMIVVTAGIGIIESDDLDIRDSKLQPGDKLIISGTVGDHGIALMAGREGISFETELVSDITSVQDIVEAALAIGGVVSMKDPTRGGLASALNEFAEKSNVSLWLEDEKIPIDPAVNAASEMLGLEPLGVTCEGRVLFGVKAAKADAVLEAIKKIPNGSKAEIIGEVKADRPGFVFSKTIVGGHRIIEKPIGEQIPRVC